MNIVEMIPHLIPFFILCVLYAVIIVKIWTKSGAISKAIVRDSDVDNIQFTFSPKDLLKIGLYILGVYLIINSFPVIFSHLSNHIVSRTRFVSREFSTYLTIRETIQLLGASTKIILSIILIKYNEKIIKYMTI